MTPIRRLIAAAGLTNLGDGIALLAWAWAASLLTRDALWVAMVPVAVRLPWVLGALPAGLMSDRHDRRRLVLGADLVRVLAFASVALILWTAAVPETPRTEGAPPLLWALLAAALAVGAAEVVRDSAAAALLPALVPREALERANGRLWSAELVGNALAGPALGALLIGLSLAAPFAAASGLYLAGGLLMLGLHAAAPPRAATRDWRAELAEGLQVLRGEPFLMRLVWITGAWNLLADMALVALVLHAQENLGAGATAYGLMLATGAVGGVLGGLAGEAAVRRIGGGRTAQIGSVIAVPVFLGLAWAPGALAAALLLALFEFGGLLWNTVSTAYRQRRVPDAARGRVNAIYRLVSFAAMPAGMLLSGALVEASGEVLPRAQALVVPFLVAGLGMAGLNAVVWRSLRRGFDG